MYYYHRHSRCTITGPRITVLCSTVAIRSRRSTDRPARRSQAAAYYTQHRLIQPRPMYAATVVGVLCALSALVGPARPEILTPPYFNLAEGRRIAATATCGVDPDGPELYCKLVGANSERNVDYEGNLVIQGQVSDIVPLPPQSPLLTAKSESRVRDRDGKKKGYFFYVCHFFAPPLLPRIRG